MKIARLLLAGCALQAAAAFAAPEDDVRATFERFVQVQNAHDAQGLDALLLDSPRFLWITRGTPVWGKEAAMSRFAALYKGTWQLEPDLAALQVIPLGADTAQVHVPVVFSIGAPGATATTTTFYLNQVLVKRGDAWKVMSIFPIPKGVSAGIPARVAAWEGRTSGHPSSSRWCRMAKTTTSSWIGRKLY